VNIPVAAYTCAHKYLNLKYRDGSLDTYKQGRNWRVTRKDLERYLKEKRG
jgi:hypothetical protein